MQKDDNVRLRHMLDSAREAVHFAEGKIRGDLDGDRLLTLALMKCIEIIGEAAKNIPKPLQAKYNELPWQDMAKLRDKISHFYFGVKYEIVWKVVKERLPEIKMDAGKMLKDLIEKNPE